MMPSEVQKITQPREHKAKVCLWADLTVSDLDTLEQATSAKDIKYLLAEIFHLDNFNEDMKTDILLDLYCYTLLFAREHNFNKEQTSAIFSIVKNTHQICTETPFGNVTQCFQYFKEAVLCHAVMRPPYSIDVFNADQVRSITEYMINTYFRHFKMYKYVFTPLVKLDLSMVYHGVPITPPPSDVDEEADDNVTEDGAVSVTPAELEEVETKEEEELSEGAKELKALIQHHLGEEIKKLKVEMEEKIKETDEAMNKKLAQVEGATGAKPGRGSSRGKKK